LNALQAGDCAGDRRWVCTLTGFHKNIVFFFFLFLFFFFYSFFILWWEGDLASSSSSSSSSFLERECFIKTNYSPSNEKRKKEMYIQAINHLKKKKISLITISSLLHLSRQISKLNDREKKKNNHYLLKYIKLFFISFLKLF